MSKGERYSARKRGDIAKLMRTSHQNLGIMASLSVPRDELGPSEPIEHSSTACRHGVHWMTCTLCSKPVRR